MFVTITPNWIKLFIELIGTDKNLKLFCVQARTIRVKSVHIEASVSII